MDVLAPISMFLASLCGWGAMDYAKPVARAAAEFNLDPRIIISMMRQESGCDPRATGKLGELGLMQLKRNTWATSGYNKLTEAQLRSPRINIRLGARHLYRCLLKCGGDLPGALGLYSGLSINKETGRCRASNYSWSILARIGES
jgi:soluble lytic murein transglycosylase-like protein